jgi:S-adenosylmethionine decarboxylase proenzyme
VKSLGKHIIVEMYDCDKRKLNNHVQVQKFMVGAAQAAKATVVRADFHQFNPYGVSGAVIIAESHLTIHTWPEYGYAAVDVFTCGDEIDPWVCVQHLIKVFQPKSHQAIEMKRGTLGLPSKMLKHKPDAEVKA